MTSSSIPYFECRTEISEILKILIDTGSNRNYIQPNFVKKFIPNKFPFFAKSVAGNVQINSHTYHNLFGQNDQLEFFLMPTLKSFHGILGNDGLKALDAIIYTSKKLHDYPSKNKYQT